MPQAPSNLRQRQVVRALVRAGGEERKGKGSHVTVKMPNGHRASIPYGIVKVGLLQAEIRQSGLTVEQFMALL
jgi:predicted RNA binding protein YcfA (HicA-like mRNA interferase family)